MSLCGDGDLKSMEDALSSVKIDDNNGAAQNVLTVQQCEHSDSQPMSLFMQSENTEYCDPNDICQNCKSLKNQTN